MHEVGLTVYVTERQHEQLLMRYGSHESAQIAMQILVRRTVDRFERRMTEDAHAEEEAEYWRHAWEAICAFADSTEAGAGVDGHECSGDFDDTMPWKHDADVGDSSR